MTTVFLNLEEFKNSSNPQDILLDREGQIWRYEQEFFGRVLKPVEQFVGGCDSISSTPAFVPSIEKKIPFIFLQQIVRFFVDVNSQCYGSEAMIQIFFDKKSREYVLYSPTQSVSATLVSYQQNIEYTSNPDYIYVMDIHSHNTMSAFFSGTDDANEQETRLYGVVGRVDKVTPDILLRSSMEGMFTMLPLDVIFDIPAHYSLDNLPFPKVDYPDEWMRSILNPSRFGNSRYLDDFGSYHHQPNENEFNDFYSDDSFREDFLSRLKGQLEGFLVPSKKKRSSKKTSRKPSKKNSKRKSKPDWLAGSLEKAVTTTTGLKSRVDSVHSVEDLPYNPYLESSREFIVSHLFKKYAKRLHVLKNTHSSRHYGSYHYLEHDEDGRVIDLHGPFFSDEILTALVERVVTLSAEEYESHYLYLDIVELEDYFYEGFEEHQKIGDVVFRVNSPIEDIAFQFLSFARTEVSLSNLPERFNAILSYSMFNLNALTLDSAFGKPTTVGYELEFKPLSGNSTLLSFFNCDKDSALEQVKEMVETFLCISCSDKFNNLTNELFIETFSSQLISSISMNSSERMISSFNHQDYSDVKHVNFSYSYQQFVKTLSEQ